MTVRELLRRVDSLELSEWMAYASIEPIGEKRQDLRFAMLACVIVNAIRGAVGSKGKPSKIEEFMLTFDPPQQQSQDFMKAMFRGMSKR